MVTSAIFRSDPRSYMRSLAFAWLSEHWAWFLIPFASVAVWCVYDVRAVYVGLILIYIIFLMALSFVWFNYAFSLQSQRAITHKTVTFTERGIDVRYVALAEGVEPMTPQSVEWGDIRSVEQGSRRLILKLGDRLDDRLEIPYDAFENEVWTEFLKFLPLTDEEALS